MLEKRHLTGKIGENVACAHLTSNGYAILQRNYRTKFGEIDIVSRALDGTLVFVEIKTMRGLEESKRRATEPAANGLSDSFLEPEDQATAAKLRKLRRTCQFFAAKYPEKVEEERGWRIDLLAIVLDKGDKILDIKHYENI